MCSDCDGLDEDPVLVRQWLDQQDAWYRDTIRTFGWAIQHVRGVPVTLFELPNPADVLFTANSVYGRRNDNSVLALQAVYPDNNGAWPWERAYELAPWLRPMPGQFQA